MFNIYLWPFVLLRFNAIRRSHTELFWPTHFRRFNDIFKPFTGLNPNGDDLIFIGISVSGETLKVICVSM